MPQHAISARQDQVEEGKAGQGQHNTLPARHEDAYTFSPPLAGNDISAALDENIDPLPCEPTAPASAVAERPDESNDNIPSHRALMVPENSVPIAAIRQSAPAWRSKPMAVIAALALLGCGAAAFSFIGFAEQKKVSPVRMELASVPPSIPAAEARTEQASTPEADTRLSAALPAAEAVPVTPAESPAQPEPIPPPAAAPESAAALPQPETPQPSTAPVAPPEAAAPRAITEAVPPRPTAESRIAAIPGAEIPRPPAAIPHQPSSAMSAPPPPARSSAQSSGLARGQVAFVQRPGVNIRNAPSQNGEIVGSAQMGGRFIVAGREGEWVQVAQGPWRGWIHERFLAPRLPREAVRGRFF
jgi:Bacterial SH3 domain